MNVETLCNIFTEIKDILQVRKEKQIRHNKKIKLALRLKK